MFARVFALLVVPALVVGLKPHPTYESFLANEVNIEIPQTDSFIQVAQEDMASTKVKCASDPQAIASESECEDNCAEGCFGSTAGGHALFKGAAGSDWAAGNDKAQSGFQQFPCLCSH